MNRHALALAGLAWVAMVGSAGAQPAPGPTAPPVARDDAPGSPRNAPGHASVIKPPASVDPGMKVAPKSTPHLPTPVIHPQVQQGNTVVVPK